MEVTRLIFAVVIAACVHQGDSSVVHIDLSHTTITLGTNTDDNFIINCTLNDTTYLGSNDSLISLSISMTSCGNFRTLATLDHNGILSTPSDHFACRGSVWNTFDPSNEAPPVLSMALPISDILLEDHGDYECALEYQPSDSDMAFTFINSDSLTVQEMTDEDVKIQFSKDTAVITPTNEDMLEISCSIDDATWNANNTIVSMSVHRMYCNRSEVIATLQDTGEVTIADSDIACRSMVTSYLDPQQSNMTQLTLSVKEKTLWCPDALEYTCELQYRHDNNNDVIHRRDSKNLTVAVLPRSVIHMLAKNVSLGQFIHEDGFTTTRLAKFCEGNVIELSCEAPKAGNQLTTKFGWRKSDVNGTLVDVNSTSEFATSTLCNRFLRSSIYYTVTSEDTKRTLDNPLYFECGLYNSVYNYESSEKKRFYIFAEKYEGYKGVTDSGNMILGSLYTHFSLALVIAILQIN